MIEKIDKTQIKGKWQNETSGGDFTNISLAKLSDKINEIIDYLIKTGGVVTQDKEPTRELWKPKEGEEYWYINNYSKISKETFEIGTGFFDDAQLIIGNYFKSQQQAQKHLDTLKAIQRVKEYIAREFGGFDPDWEDYGETKYCVYLKFIDGIKVDYFNNYKNYSPIGYLKSQEDCEKLIKECKEDLELIYK